MDPAALLAVHEEDYPGLRDAFIAFRAKEVARCVAATLMALGVDRPASGQTSAGASWVCRRGSAVIVISHDRRDNSITLEAPLVDICPETEVPLLRAALSAGAKLGSARPARRGDKLLLTMTHAFLALPPPRLAHAIDEISGAADALDNVLAAEFGVRLLGPMMRKGHVFDLGLLGEPKRLKTVTAADRPVRLQPTSSSPSTSLGSATANGGPAIDAASVTRFLEVVRELQQICVGLGFAPLPDDDEAALHIAGAWRCAYAGGVELDAARVLVRQALAIRAKKEPAATMRALYGRITQDRGHTASRDPLTVPRVSAQRVKSVLAQHVAVAARTKTTAIRRTMLLGGLAELVLCADLPTDTLARLRALHDGSQGADIRAVDTLMNAMREKIR